MMKADSITIDKQRFSGHSRISEKSFADDDYEDEIVPLKFDGESTSQDGPRKLIKRNSSGNISEISDLSIGDKSEDLSELAANISFPTGDSDEESDADSRALIKDWEDDLSDVDSISSGSSQKQPMESRLSSLLQKDQQHELDYDAENDDLLLAPSESAAESPGKPLIEVEVPDYIWQSPESLKKKSLKLESPKSPKSRENKEALQETKIDEDSLSDGSAIDTGSVLSVPQDQIQKPLFDADAPRTPEQLSTPVKDFASPDAMPLVTPTQIGKKKLRKKTYLVEEQEDGKISRYNPMFYSESKQGPLIDQSRTKKEKLEAKKQRKREIREERDRMKDFHKTMDSFAAGGLVGDSDEEKEDENDGKDDPPTPRAGPPSLDAFFASTSSTEPETDTSTSKEGSSASYDDEDDFSLGSMDSIEGVTKVKKSSRKKKGKKTTGKKKAAKKKKTVKKRGRRADYEPEGDIDVEPERPPIPIDERVELIFADKQLIYQLHPDVEAINPEDANREPRKKSKVKSKASSGRKGSRSRSRSRSVDRAGREMVRKFQKKRSSSSGALGRDSKRDRMVKRSNSSRSFLSSSDDDELDPKSKPTRSVSGGITKLFGKKPRPPRPKPGGEKKRSSSFSAMTKNMKVQRDQAFEEFRDEVKEPLNDLRMAASEHVQSSTRGKKSAKGGLSKSDHGGRRGRGGMLSKSNHENGVKAPMRGKRSNPPRPPTSKSPARGDKKRDSSKSKSPTSMNRKKLDQVKAETRSPSAMQRKKQLARDESMRKFEEILGKRDIVQSPSAIKKRSAMMNSPKREKNKVDSSHSRNSDGGSKSPSSMRRKRQEASGEAKESSRHSLREYLDEDRMEADENKPKSLRKKRSNSGELKRSKSQGSIGLDGDDNMDSAEEKPKSLRKKKSDVRSELKSELKRSKSQLDLEDGEDRIDTEEKPKSLRKKKSDMSELKSSKSQSSIDFEDGQDRIDTGEKPKSLRKKKSDMSELKSSIDLEDAEDRIDTGEKPKSLRKKKSDVKSELKKSKSQSSIGLDNDEDDRIIDQEEKPKSSRKKKADLDELKSRPKPDPSGFDDTDRMDPSEEKPKSLRKKKADIDNDLKRSKSLQDPSDEEADLEEKPKSSRKKKADPKPDPDSLQDPSDEEADLEERPKSSRKKKADPKPDPKPDPDSQHQEDEEHIEPGDGHAMEPPESSRTLDSDKEVPLEDESSTRRKKARDTIQRTRSRSRDFFDGMVETVKTVKTKTPNIKAPININTSSIIKSMKLAKSPKETAGGSSSGGGIDP